MKLITIGKNFNVEVHNDYVIKIPKKDEYRQIEKLSLIADAHTYLSKHIKGILPCKVIDGSKLKMPFAKGERLDLYEERKFRSKNQTPLINFRSHIEQLKQGLYTQIESHGYSIADLRSVNLFYDETDDTLYIIDFSAIKKRKADK